MIHEMVGVKIIEVHDKYLGLPTNVSRSKKIIFSESEIEFGIKKERKVGTRKLYPQLTKILLKKRVLVGAPYIAGALSIF